MEPGRDPTEQAGWGRGAQRSAPSERDPIFREDRSRRLARRHRTRRRPPVFGVLVAVVVALLFFGSLAVVGWLGASTEDLEPSGGFARLAYALLMLGGFWMAFGNNSRPDLWRLAGVALVGLGFVLLLGT